jgi:hypothetical protein
MKAIWKRYLNEIVGLAVMALMTIALIAGQAQAPVGEPVGGQSGPILEIHLTTSP